MQSTEPEVKASKQGPSVVRKPQKITQLLCLDQNSELKSIFTTWLSQSFKYLPGWLSAIYLELELIISFIEFRFTVSRDKPQVGDYLQNIKYKNLNKKIKVLFLLLDVIGPYLKRKLVIVLEKIVQNHEKQMQNLGEDDERPDFTTKDKIINVFKKVLNLIAFFDKIYALANFINLAIFIKNGKFRSIIQRLLGMEMEFVNPQNSRVLDFTLMNRTMIWQIYEMVLKNILPYLYKFMGTGLKNVFYLHSYMGVEDKQDDEGCVVCEDVPTMAVKADPCGHVYCFYCSKTADSERSQCKKCGEMVESWSFLKA